MSDLVNDSDLGAQSYTLYRTTGSFGPGGWEGVEEAITGYGIVQPASAKELRQVPEGDRVEGAMVFFSSTPLYATNTEGRQISDQIEWRGERYRLYQMLPWVDAGFYRAIGTRIKGS